MIMEVGSNSKIWPSGLSSGIAVPLSSLLSSQAFLGTDSECTQGTVGLAPSICAWLAALTCFLFRETLTVILSAAQESSC